MVTMHVAFGSEHVWACQCPNMILPQYCAALHDTYVES